MPANNQPAAFRFTAKNIFLTYPRCDVAPPVFVEWIKSQFPTAQYWTVAQERHEDGGLHLHAVISFSRKYNSRVSTRFDFEGHHPNIQPVRVLRDVIAYISKDPIQLVTTHPQLGETRRTYGDIVANSTSTSEAEQAIKLWYPRDWLLFGDRIRTALNLHFRPQEEIYSTPTGLQFVPKLPFGLENWLVNEVNHDFFCICRQCRNPNIYD